MHRLLPTEATFPSRCKYFVDAQTTIVALRARIDDGRWSINEQISPTLRSRQSDAASGRCTPARC